MNFFITLLILIGSYALSFILCSYLLPLISLPATLLAGEPPYHWKEKRTVRFRAGVFINALVIGYIYLSYVAFVLKTVKSAITTGILLYVLWLIAIIVIFQPFLWVLGVQGARQKQRLEELDIIPFDNDPYVISLQYASGILLVGFLTMCFSNNTLNNLFAWIPQIK